MSGGEEKPNPRPRHNASWSAALVRAALGFERCPFSHRLLVLLLVELTWNLRVHEVSHNAYKALRCHSGLT